ncbi:MAG: hypothetical protein QF796_06060 [Acidimicrobiales bacterium]|jgi:hypothetical protein|nr:hypothetical protein [Acidimicrobiaceae bacterium]MDP6493142.1 hypothetical protein [Acidimicrobiales bacterium]MDP6649682.1 hypothetical protein [Acidimicrobiales bacterium]MDP6759758.1 hypothetical protein [Acidimicrobiales bacterium]|tara:strand:- start:5968 stop:6276 length:309 start_codon:yes stop_codon:yes gene_type:complete
MPELTPGSRWASQVCTTEVIIVRAPDGDVDLECGGSPVVPVGEGGPNGPPDAEAAGGSLLGKRYVDGDDTLELLCTKPGDGSLGAGGTLLDLKDAKPLPASD